ncbi:MAG: diaminopropionate ammonia-lyase, partial [Gammaproteobacteria bacterium]|nr:diaminopropionate ammonia-lyase [Gammaproteobacteria bacterium]
TAWPILRDAARWFIAIPDELAANTMRRLAHPLPGDGPIVAGESAVAGLAACIEVAQSASQRQALRLDQHARVLVFGTEGATDRGMYEQIVGKSPADVLKEA